MEEKYIKNISELLHYYQRIAEQAIEQIDERFLFVSPVPDSNSIATIMQHIAGNQISRWTDFFTSDGEKPNRNRDAEFELNFTDKKELMQFWQKGWKALYKITDNLTAADLEKDIIIRGENHKALEAINRQLAHYPYHIGQIIYLAKMWKGATFKSLSIPKGDSAVFNERKDGKTPWKKN